MSKTFRCALVLIIFIGISLPLPADFKYNLTCSSSYIWRGFDLNPYKKHVLQPSLEYRFGNSGFSAGVWSSFSFENKQANEIDLILTYDFEIFDQMLLETGFIHYGWYFMDYFRFKEDTSQEIFLKAGFSEMFLSPSFSVYYDFTNGDGFYFLVDSFYSQKITGFMEAKLSSSLGYNAGQWLAEGVDHGFSDLNFGITLPITIGKFSISGFAHYTFVLLEAIGKENHFWYGVYLTYK